MARAMWTYHSLAYGVNQAARYASMRGQGCSVYGNTCSTTVANVVAQVTSAAPALLSANLSVKLTSPGGTVNCNPVSNCSSNATMWPPSGSNSEGAVIQVYGSYSFHTALAMFWPGAGTVNFTSFTLPAYATQPILF